MLAKASENKLDFEK